jgi:mono/diheme cytochrome c family protein
MRKAQDLRVVAGALAISLAAWEQLGAQTYGPPLSKASLGGQEDVMREVIANGTPRMPAFKYHFEPAQIDAIVRYLKTVPAQ